MHPQFQTWNYPGGEVGVRATSVHTSNSLFFRIQNSEDLIKLLMYVNAVQPSGLSTKHKINQIIIPYLPYARQDRIATNGDPVAIDVLAKVLATTGVREFITLDVHSKKSIYSFMEVGCILTSIDPTKYIKRYKDTIIKNDRPFFLISPDNGAREKTKKYAELLGANGTIFFNKTRDPVTGKLSGFSANLPRLAKDVTLIIVDDICDGGGTFNSIVDILRSEYPNHSIHLWTTHGIYSKGIVDLLDKFQSLGSTNSFLHKYRHSRLFSFEIEGDFKS